MTHDTVKRLMLSALLTVLVSATSSHASQIANHGEPSPMPSMGIQGDLQLFRGVITVNLPIDIRIPEGGKISCRVELPDSPLLPARLYFLKEDRTLLRWQDPVSAREIYQAEGELARLLAEIPARILITLLTGNGVGEFIRVSDSRQRGGRTIRRGTFLDREAVLETVDHRARALTMILGSGTLEFKWRYHPAARRILLDIILPGGESFRLRMRSPRPREISETDWVYLDR